MTEIFAWWSFAVMKIRDVTYCGLFAALIAVCSWISLPADPPFTLQLLAVFLAVRLLGGRRGTVCVVVYILLGAVGAPVFAAGKGGVGVLLGPTGGYIVGFLATALVMWALERPAGGRLWLSAAAMLLGLVACYAFGSAWYMAVFLRTRGPVSLGAVLARCVLPFIVPDLAKLALALYLSERLKRIRPGRR